jgi:hypothetical protein
MKMVSYEIYLEDKLAFLKRHEDWKVDTSPLDKDGNYTKQYICEDGAVFTEHMHPIYEDVEAEVEVKGIKLTLKDSVKLMQVEYYRTDYAKSRYYYEKW